MSKPITYWVDTPTIQKLSESYGARFEKMELSDAAELLAVLGMAAYICAIGEEPVLSEIPGTDGIEVSEDIQAALEALDEELSVNELLNLIQGLASVIPSYQLSQVMHSQIYG